MSPASPTTGTKRAFYVGTRKSALALEQTDIVIKALQQAWPELEFHVHSLLAAGDKNKITPLREMTSKNLWTEELEELLVSGKLDLVVHSLKDVPTQIPSTCVLSGTVPRENPHDVLCVKKSLPYKSIDELPAGSVIGTSSVRRAAQIARHYPHLKIVDVRGNVGTRLAKLDDEEGPFTAIILAAAGLIRLNLDERITQTLTSKEGNMLHAVGQGAIGIEVRKGDDLVLGLLERITDKKATYAVLAERALLRKVEGGCSAPLGVETEWVVDAEGKDVLQLRSNVVSVDGKECADALMQKAVTSDAEAEAFGEEVADALWKDGADKILADIQAAKKV